MRPVWFIVAAGILVVSCGKGHEKGPATGPAVEPPAPRALDGSTGAVPPETAASRQKQGPHDQLLVGTFEQVDNRQAKIRVSEDLLVTTNLIVPVESVGSTGTRLSPTFPHHLKWNATDNFYYTVGFYNTGTTFWENVELRLEPYEGGRLLDVTLVLGGVPSTGSNGGSSASAQGGCPTVVCLSPCVPDPCDPCAPLEPCAACFSVQPCFYQGASTTTGEGGAAGEGRPQRLAQYRYERAPDVSNPPQDQQPSGPSF